MTDTRPGWEWIGDHYWSGTQSLNGVSIRVEILVGSYCSEPTAHLDEGLAFLGAISRVDACASAELHRMGFELAAWQLGNIGLFPGYDEYASLEYRSDEGVVDVWFTKDGRFVDAEIVR
ncbi:MAG: hypothetical protein R3F61_25360 [Myxococcota bacterium]